MTWDEFLDKNASTVYNGQMLTDIECPECKRHIYFDDTIHLMSYPGKYVYWCACGWKGYAPNMWVKEGDTE